MLCPEVWNFNPPSDSVIVYSGSSNSEHYEELIKHHYYNHNVSVVFPECPKIPEELIKNLTDDCDYYKVVLPVSEFIEKQFIDLFILSGELTALSVGTRIDVDDCACVTPNGVLVLSLLRETYQKFGTEGTPWGNPSNKPDRYAVTIDLKKDCFKPGKPNYERVKRSCSELVPLQFEFILAWEPPSGKSICPSSVASYLSSRGYDVRLCSPTFTYKTEQNVLVPNLKTTEPDELIEWLGAFSLGVLKNESLPTSSLEYLTTYSPPKDCENKSQVVLFQWTGFFTNKKITQLFVNLWNFILNEGVKMPWLSVNVSGFSDSPVTWRMNCNSHSRLTHNHYTVFMKPDLNVITYKVKPIESEKNKKQNKWCYVNKIAG